MTHDRYAVPIARPRGAILSASGWLACAALAACSPASESEAPRAATEADAGATPKPGPAAPSIKVAAPGPTPSLPPPSQAASGATIGGDGSPIQLVALSGTDIQAAKLGGELACNFAGRDGASLLHATGIVASSERAFGIVKILDSVETVSAPDGFDGMLGGATFVGRGKTIRIELAGGPPTGGGESPPRSATLTYERADGASRTFPGAWTCGP